MLSLNWCVPLSLRQKRIWSMISLKESFFLYVFFFVFLSFTLISPICCLETVIITSPHCSRFGSSSPHQGKSVKFKNPAQMKYE